MEDSFSETLILYTYMLIWNLKKKNRKKEKKKEDKPPFCNSAQRAGSNPNKCALTLTNPDTNWVYKHQNSAERWREK